LPKIEEVKAENLFSVKTSPVGNMSHEKKDYKNLNFINNQNLSD
jgi:hypothetical protein